MKTILVATDFSRAALNATNYAIEMALVIDADLYLLHVFQTPGTSLQVPMPLILDEMLQDVKGEMDKQKEYVVHKTAGKLAVKTEVRREYFFAELEAVCDRIKPYCVIMGSQGTTAAERLAFGGHAVYAMRHLEWPLVTVPPFTSFSSVKKIALACDFDDAINTMPLDKLKALVNDFGATLFVLNTGKKEEFNPDIVSRTRLLEQELGTIKPHYNFIANPDIDAGILGFVEDNNIDLLIVLPKHYDFLHNLLHKSHTKQMVLHSKVPVLALH
jgi:nucleotide-binding universal stress UspA family protein